ncbi:MULTISPECIES: ABC exporter membrane fusion protein [Aphanizomenonaceae]|uniref:ABC exporter membrane fusion protein n=1 Tax=Dolichospermum heterosporum TAC447 TaxID=747523 RepID=A0ABY5LS78_9CYAN|nr:MULTISPECIES: ABC exporter membrane fusion protein [Aphanizomenonaceae]MBE9258422.1 ABC exporter membrane fusion protein [Dolichospermum sp. LEGE 00246]MDK2408087.1 ABC exporter membrane fusion protein [Aphanizomenon sp. 202]MDK2458425.1 ABC exporter membrane fusion protein [Aphanizomenon sp. PH219]UUO13592.1 ABC exporter membrane fusion protein [Dolichospermum heterosporum TAC447]
MAVNKERQLFNLTPLKWRIILATSLTFSTGLVSLYIFHQLKTNSQTQTPAVSSVIKSQPTPVKVAVTALGRLQPQDKITYLSAPNSVNGVRVEKLLVKEGDNVKKGQVLAYLENYARSQAAIQQAFDKLLIARTKLAQVQAGAKTGDINAQKTAITRLNSQLKGDVAAQTATINRIRAEVENAQKESDRYQQLSKAGAVSASVADSKKLVLKTTQQQLKEAEATLKRTKDTLQDQLKEGKFKLNSIKEVRTVDVELAKTEVKSAETAIKQAKADHDLTYITSTIDGTILRIHTKNGEVIGTSGFAEIGNTSKMQVLAEVYQTDIQNVRLGQKAIITSTTFPGKLQGTVREVGWQVDKQGIFSINPNSDADRRVIEVKISIDDSTDSQKISRLTNLQVDVAIQI